MQSWEVLLRFRTVRSAQGDGMRLEQVKNGSGLYGLVGIQKWEQSLMLRE